jgi:hypothetical protein
VSAWPVWRERYQVLIVLAVVEALGLAAPIATWSPVSKADIDLALLLTSLSVTYSLFVIGWEKARRLLLFERAPAMTPDVLAVWCFGAAVLLSPTLAAVVTAIAAIADWPSHPAHAKRLHRYVYSSLASVLAATVASWTIRHHLPLVEALPLAAAAWLATGAGATILAMCASGQFGAVRRMLHFQSHRLEITTMAVAVGEYAAYRAGLPLLIWLSLPIAVGIQRYFTAMELRSREPDAAPMDRDVWLHVAKVIVDASDTVSVLRIDTADPQAAQMIAMMQGGCDAIGRYPDGGLAILLPDCPPAQGDAIARRLRIAMGYHKVPCNIASASKPRDGQVLNSLLAVSEAELVLSNEAAKRPASPSQPGSDLSG